MSELAEKRRRLHAILDAEGLDALVLQRTANVAWLSCGGRAHVVTVQETGVAAVVVTRDGEEVVAPVNEAPRLEDEELAALRARLRTVPWDADLAGELPTGARVGTDTPSAGRRDVSEAVVAARRSLTPEEAGRYRTLGRDAAEALTATLDAASPEWTEHEAAAQAARACLERAIDPIVLLVAGERRLPRHRHPLPTAEPLGRLAMVVVCARRAGLVASLTRVVSFGGLGPELADAQERLLRVDVAFNRATRAGAIVGDVFRAGTAAYAEHGFDPEEWRLHHQGGPTGYEPRDELATAESAARVEPHQAFAWNPSVPGLKCEDTVLATDGPPEILTVDGRWPTAAVGGLMRPLVLER